MSRDVTSITNDDSTPGAIRIPGIVTELDTLKNNGSTEEGQDPQMKRYLLCPGMCRIEVLKKFIRNKYNVDTNQFFKMHNQANIASVHEQKNS
ncbi:hypothetical protein D910_01656 [Dendroctonus ponderosae]|uniref:Uncharacterized protein n=1 Tax=Dendroctonus ponderosae TaxID=77166 RepID=U4U2P3_DENPD|nr:hypothetical protein D910_01656 [Dendroctonus ponderosae]